MSSRQKPRKFCKITTRVIVFLVLGALMSAGVAWACFAMNARWRTDLAILQATASFAVTPVPTAPAGSTSGSSSAFLPGGALLLGPVNERKRAWCYDVSLSGTSHATRASVCVGWPVLCVQAAEFDGRIDQLRRRPISGAVDVLQRTIWPGFAINTLLYAAILWLLLAAPLALRRRRRIQRGLCGKCAYPVGGSDVCTECGAAVRTGMANRHQPTAQGARDG